MSDTLVSADDLRAMLTETGLPAVVADASKAMCEGLPPKPVTPDGAPSDFQEALFTPGVCAIPLWSGDRWRFGAICDGMPVRDQRTGRIVMFDEYDEAISQLRGWHEWMLSQGGRQA